MVRRYARRGAWMMVVQVGERERSAPRVRVIGCVIGGCTCHAMSKGRYWE